MSELTLMVLRIGFLLLLWLFIFAIVYALRSDLFGAPVRKLPSGNEGGRSSVPPVVGAPIAAAAAAQGSAPPITPSGGALPSAGGALLSNGATAAAAAAAAANSADASVRANTLVITSGSAAGTSLQLDDGVITIGRSSDSTLAIVDEYTSTYHAKLARSGDQWLLTDLDSTNGTKLNGSRVTGTVLVPAFTQVTIGTTTFELRP